ncbi:hypothetical protein GFER_01130 [Geoalkalibacter ferrihydriticus DSM 17813]|uniref:methylated-DNA--[protein]-cysteine S-methyltransferase n=1 Tax=Geoalkalibacter ferrihydriticus DSM 17813 TaxID=1121915 RepID=A0A0C2HTQ5_9BACT|nr:hypothetical protein GFER_01130 [Geoalkalibacter ferrihydriticus DSM 17813]
MFSTPVGWLGLVGGPRGLVDIQMHTTREAVSDSVNLRFPLAHEELSGVLVDARTQLLEYFAGKRERFNLPLDWRRLSDFQRRVLRHLQQLPFAELTTYGEMARQVGAPRAARAIGAVMAVNPFVIVVPCHRVLGRGGRMTGYSGGAGIASKQWLLDFERRSLRNDGDNQ